MNLPSWVVNQPRRQPVLPTVTRPVRDSFYSAPGWRELDMEFSCCEGEYPRDPAVTRAIRTFDPDMIPLWVRWVFLSPQETGAPYVEVFGRHAIGRWVKNPHYLHEPLRVLTPFHWRGPTPNQVDLILEGVPDPRAADLPGAFVPWDWRLYYFLRKAYTDHRSAKELAKQFVHDPAEAQRRAQEQVRAEFEYRQRDLQRYAQKQLDKVSEVEAREFFTGGKFEQPSRPIYSKPIGLLSGDLEEPARPIGLLSGDL